MLKCLHNGLSKAPTVWLACAEQVYKANSVLSCTAVTLKSGQNLRVDIVVCCAYLDMYLQLHSAVVKTRGSDGDVLL